MLTHYAPPSLFGTRSLRLSLSVGALLAMQGCADPAGPSPLPEVHGNLIASAGPMALTWAPSGRDVAFVSADYRSLLAHTVQTGATRQLWVSTSLTDQIQDALLPADGAEWFTTSYDPRSSTDLQPVIRRHTATGSTILTKRGYGLRLSPADGRGVLLAPGEPLVTFLVKPDSLFLMRRGSEPTFVGAGCRGLIAFSPDQSQVLCRAQFAPSTFRILRLDRSGSDSLALPSDVAGSSNLFRWDETGLRVVYYRNGEYWLYGLANGSTHFLAPASSGHEVIAPHSWAWSGDGKAMAYWATGYCPPQGLCQSDLFVLDLSTGKANRVAVHTDTQGNARVAFSPDGTTVAYYISGTVYLLKVR
ncbi:MAG: hypothetical protein EXR93_05950 [Gemmatimonadetes bacterium]|nr:hypothetical protein [Gemmatimonadota bacterium]